MAQRVGTAGNDDGLTTGTVGNDQIYGLNGNDIAKGLGGNDSIYGGDGDDMIGERLDIVNDQEEGDDYLNGGAGNDQMHGGGGNDEMEGGSGNDQMRGGIGNDVMNGDTGDDQMDGGEGVDLVSGGLGADLVGGGADKDKLWGGGDRDTFLFDNFGKANADKIMDWEKKDQFGLEVDIFAKAKFDSNGILKKKYFEVGKEADDKKDRIIYDEDKGKVYWDPTGSKNGKSDMELIAKVDKGTTLKYKDFEMYDDPLII